jgi:hypothetical protein
MTSPFVLRHEWNRLRFRLEVLWRGVISATAWIAIFGLYSVLEPRGLAMLLNVALVALALVGLPILFVQAALMVDALSYLVLREIRFYPWFRQLVESNKRNPAQRASVERDWLYVLVTVVDVLSPLYAPTLWVFLLLRRAPESAYAAVRAPDDSVRATTRDLQNIERTVTDRGFHQLAAA